jgi:hypothetical protein
MRIKISVDILFIELGRRKEEEERRKNEEGKISNC